MAISNKQVTVGGEATLVFGADPDGARIHVRSDGEVYLGSATVTVNNGIKLKKDEFLNLFVGPDELLYGIVAAETETVYVLATMNQ